MSVTLEKLASLAKRRGFIYQGSEIYGGLAGTWDYGPLGVQLKRNLQNLWWKMFVEERDDMYGLDSAVLMNSKVWEASGHVNTFSDPLVECDNCQSKFREDQIDTKKCPSCGKEGTFRPPVDFNLMFNTHIGPSWGSFETSERLHVAGNIDMVENETGKKTGSVPIREGDTFNSVTVYEKNARVYLRPETAQGMFVNFKNIVDSFSPNLPFGIAQIGRAFRNEISPREFIFRVREFEIMELEYFIEEKSWKKVFEHWQQEFYKWCELIGLDKKKVHELEVPKEDRAHYSKRTIDFEYKFPFGTKEIAAIAYRTDFDLANHQKHSGANLEYRPKDPSVAGGKAFIPHVIEPTFGLDRTLLAVLSEAYREEKGRVWLALKPELAPVKVAVFPLLKNKPELVKKAREVYQMLQKEIGLVDFDDNGNIGKRYRRQDEIGTPKTVTVDFDTLEDDTVTIRDRDSMRQKRVKARNLKEELTDGK